MKILMSLKNKIALFTDKTFIKFVMVGFINTIVGTTIMFVFYNFFYLSYWVSSASNYLAMLLGMCLFIVFNYLGQRFFAFKNKKRQV
ncbi:MAG: GtrA family protein [Lachnospiraceae bacterium]|nr:GtrA family protein [Lachnospiraceae bacterium]